MMKEDVLSLAIKTFGEKEQEEVAMEECAELIQAISHKHRGRKNNIAEEIADVEIMLEQLKIINDCHEKTAHIKRKKLLRLKDYVLHKNGVKP
jgi:NTP pyrophosphatase (non-canonical NTP hydrolase)